jgi:hypothetical protein
MLPMQENTSGTTEHLISLISNGWNYLKLQSELHLIFTVTEIGTEKLIKYKMALMIK